MYPRTNYEMSTEDKTELLEACKPTPCIMVGDYTPSTPQENANRAWKKLGEKMGFDSMTVAPISGKGNRFFTAVPLETDYQRNTRMQKEAEQARAKEIEWIRQNIYKLQNRLSVLKGEANEV